jgi:HK97 family phage portal protein
MWFWQWIKGLFGEKPVTLSGGEWPVAEAEYEKTAIEVHVRLLALMSAVNIIANAVSKCEFRTFLGGIEKKEREWYLWNIEPNKNQNSSAFMREIVTRLYTQGECLVVEQGSNLLVADSFTRTEYALFDDVFKQVTVGDFTFGKSFYGSDVLYFSLGDVNMRKVVEGLSAGYAKLLNYTMTAYQRSRGKHGIFKFDTLPPGESEERKRFDDLINEKIKKWLASDNAALPLGRGQEWKESTEKTYSSESTRDIRAMIDDVSDFTAKAFGIPPALLKGNVAGTKDAYDQFLTFCIDPLTDMLSEEINRKRNGYAGHLRGDRLMIDTKQIKHVDLLSVSTAIDKLISSGAFCVNDIRKLVGDEPIEEDWAYAFWITKNYMPINKALQNPKGGNE